MKKKELLSRIENIGEIADKNLVYLYQRIEAIEKALQPTDAATKMTESSDVIFKIEPRDNTSNPLVLALAEFGWKLEKDFVVCPEQGIDAKCSIVGDHIQVVVAIDVNSKANQYVFGIRGINFTEGKFYALQPKPNEGSQMIHTEILHKEYLHVNLCKQIREKIETIRAKEEGSESNHDYINRRLAEKQAATLTLTQDELRIRILEAQIEAIEMIPITQFKIHNNKLIKIKELREELAALQGNPSKT